MSKVKIKDVILVLEEKDNFNKAYPNYIPLLNAEDVLNLNKGNYYLSKWNGQIEIIIKVN